MPYGRPLTSSPNEISNAIVVPQAVETTKKDEAEEKELIVSIYVPEVIFLTWFLSTLFAIIIAL